jgi:CHRD domain
MMKKLALAVAIVSIGAVALIAAAIAKNGSGGGGRNFGAKLTGYEEIIPGVAPAAEGGAISTTGRGSFRARVERENSSFEIEYRLRYEALEGADTIQAHIHFGQRHTLGGISAFLCDSTANDIPDCTNTNGDISGTIEAADILGPAGQGIEAQNITELIRAMRNGATYVNVHTDKWPSGEIRGQIDHGFHFGFFRGKGKGKRGDDD